MKKIFLIFCILGICKTSFSQTNNITVSSAIGVNITGNTSSFVGTDINITRGSSNLGVGQSSDIQFNDASGSSLLQAGQGTFQFFNNTGSGWNENMRIDSAGNVGIGTSNPLDYKLAVNGNMIAESVKVKLHANWPDYIFHKTYALQPLSEVEKYIAINQHLPEIPSAKEVEKNGINLGEINAKLLQKIEELTLYLIDQNKMLQKQIEENNEQGAKIKDQQDQINQLKSKP